MVEKININTVERELLPDGGRRCVVHGSNMSFACYYVDAADLPKKVPSHSHEYEAAIMWLQGKARVNIGGVIMDTSPGDMYFIPPWVEHSSEMIEGPVVILDITHPPIDLKKWKV